MTFREIRPLLDTPALLIVKDDALGLRRCEAVNMTDFEGAVQTLDRHDGAEVVAIRATETQRRNNRRPVLTLEVVLREG